MSKNFLNYSILKKNYNIIEFEKINKYIQLVNKLNLLPEEKLKLINFKPKNNLELNLVK
jgi:hypothetical protein